MISGSYSGPPGFGRRHNSSNFDSEKSDPRSEKSDPRSEVKFFLFAIYM